MTIATDMALHSLETEVTSLLKLTETPEGLAELEADPARWFGVLLAFSLVGSRLTHHMGRGYEKRLRLVGGAL